MALRPDLTLHTSLWLTDWSTASVSAGMEDQRRTFKRELAGTLAWMRFRSEVGSQGDVAKLVGTSEATYRRWENPERPEVPDVWQTRRLSEVYGATPQELMYPDALTDREREILRRALRARRPAQQDAS